MSNVANRDVQHLVPGEVATTFVPGDFFLVCDWNEDFLGRLIRAGERVQFGNVDATRWSHSGMIVSVDGDIVEAEAAGIQRNNISKYQNADLYVVHPDASTEQRDLAVAQAISYVGDNYGIVDFISLALQCLFGWKLTVLWDQQFICSGLVARCTEKYIVGYPKAPENMMPAALAFFWKVASGQVLPEFNWFDKVLNAVVGLTHIFRKQKNDNPS